MVPTSRRTSRHALIAKYGSTPITNTLISRGIADVAQVQAALDICKATGKSLITVLAERLGQPLDPALERQYRRQELFELRVIYGLPILDLDVEPIDTTQLAHLLQAYFAPANDPTSTNICQHHLYLPLSLTNSTLRIAMVQPDNLNTLDNITKRLAAHELQFKRLAITRTDFNRLMGQYLDWLASKLDAEATGTLAAISTAIGTLDFQPFLDPQSDDDPQDDELNGTLPNAEEAPIIKLAKSQ
ncbi:MAG: hypothetical protein HC926_04415 [Synechococcaceae cyanobacterium SM2_3_60]|nr:hypothetical protein [Synechococcaceae cyanobacterium SM2_3_60]